MSNFERLMIVLVALLVALLAVFGEGAKRDVAAADEYAAQEAGALQSLVIRGEAALKQGSRVVGRYGTTEVFWERFSTPEVVVVNPDFLHTLCPNAFRYSSKYRPADKPIAPDYLSLWLEYSAKNPGTVRARPLLVTDVSKHFLACPWLEWDSATQRVLLDKKPIYLFSAIADR